MPVTEANHFTILTDDLPTTLDFYAEFLALRPGPRPPFTFPGAWLYADGGNDRSCTSSGRDRKDLVKGVLDHMAYTGKDLPGTVAKLKAKGIPYELRRLPEYRTWQLFFFDPNNAKIEIDFDPAETGPA
jgi:catechol 2,3-dioxygenase-like lactoylglutathione lyase family enzyme